MMKKLINGSMKGLVVAFGVLSLTAISCTKSDESLQPNQSEIQSRRHTSGGTGGVTSGIPQPTGLSATATGPTSVYLSWNSVPNATAYWIYRDNYVPAIVSGTSYTDGYLSPGTTYTYAIAAVVNSTLGPKSGSVTVTTP
ncbi:MAG TPA: fibronectin type III domain-containing protein [Chitinophagaceae bacterium]|nr:fibronectin type III domain-containing protein [Chitinophagaceae bacterium]